jgi:hypothetical protein
MSLSIDRRQFAALGVGFLAASQTGKTITQEPQKNEQDGAKKSDPEVNGPVEASFQRDYDAPGFKPGWKKPQINRLLAQDFVIYAHSDLEMVKKLYDREPGLINAAIDWGAGDWETALGGASHMGKVEIVKFLLSKGARSDIFCAAMLGMLETVKQLLVLEPGLIDAKGPHGFSLHFHAQVGQVPAEPVLEFLQSIKKIELRPVPFLKQENLKK